MTEPGTWEGCVHCVTYVIHKPTVLSCCPDPSPAFSSSQGFAAFFVDGFCLPHQPVAPVQTGS